MPEQHMPEQHMPGQENLRGYKKFQDVFIAGIYPSEPAAQCRTLAPSDPLS